MFDGFNFGAFWSVISPTLYEVQREESNHDYIQFLGNFFKTQVYEWKYWCQYHQSPQLFLILKGRGRQRAEFLLRAYLFIDTNIVVAEQKKFWLRAPKWRHETAALCSTWETAWKCSEYVVFEIIYNLLKIQVSEFCNCNYRRKKMKRKKKCLKLVIAENILHVTFQYKTGRP